MTKNRIALITGTRAEFGPLESVLIALKQKGVDHRLIVTGMHLLEKFGHTIDEIHAKGYRVDATVPMQTGQDDGGSEAAAVARGIEGIAAALDRHKCNLTVVLGDRIEAFAGAAAAVTSRRAVAHIHGGDKAPGDIDESLRNAITRLAHIHFAASPHAVSRLKRMGEPAERVHLVGAPGLDAIRTFRMEEKQRPRQSDNRLQELLGDLAARPYAVVVLHASGRDKKIEARLMRATIEAVDRRGLAGVAIWPNSDPGHDGIIAELNKLKSRPTWRVFQSLARDDYLRVVWRSAVLVGNSSSGIIESASLGVNAVNIGQRQKGRLRCGTSVVDSRETLPCIEKAVCRALSRPRPNPECSVYGEGRAGQKIATTLGTLQVNQALLQKELAF